MKRAKKMKCKLASRIQDWEQTVGKGTSAKAYKKPGSGK